MQKQTRTRTGKMPARINNGFEIAEVGLKLCVPGNLQDTQQSDILELKIANLIKDGKILNYARDLANQLLDEDPELSKPGHSPIKKHLNEFFKHEANWGLIS